MRQKLNISQRAYAHLTSHIRSVFSRTGQGNSRIERAIRALNEYIEGSRHDFENLRGIPEVELAMMMLQPEIDRCLARSAAARARAQARKEARKRPKEPVTMPETGFDNTCEKMMDNHGSAHLMPGSNNVLPIDVPTRRDAFNLSVGEAAERRGCCQEGVEQLTIDPQ